LAETHQRKARLTIHGACSTVSCRPADRQRLRFCGMAAPHDSFITRPLMGFPRGFFTARCPECGYELERDADECPNCGAIIGDYEADEEFE